jgi:hypothetical protein
VFFGNEDYELSRDLLSSQRAKQGVTVAAYCLTRVRFTEAAPP